MALLLVSASLTVYIGIHFPTILLFLFAWALKPGPLACRVFEHPLPFIGKTRRFDVTRIRRIAGITGFIPVIPGNRRDHPRDPGDPRHCRSDPSDPGPRP